MTGILLHVLTIRVFVFAGSPTGYDEIWIIGDTHMLARARAVLQDLKDIQLFNKEEPRARLPYIIENFEVLTGAFHHSWCFTTQMIGGLNSLLADKWKLPNYIYILFSNEQIHDSEELGDELFPVLKDLFTAITRAITTRRLLLPNKAKRSKPPSICVVRTVPKSETKQAEKNFKNKRRTLNRALQRLAADFGWRTLNIDTILPKQEKHFDESGEELSNEGFRLFWNFISDDLRAVESASRTSRKPYGVTKNYNYKTGYQF